MIFSQNCIFQHAGQNILKTAQTIHLKFLGALCSYLLNHDLNGKNSFQTLEKHLLPLRSTIMDFEVHYEKYTLLKSFLCYNTITCQNFSLALFLYLQIFWPDEDIFCPFSRNLAGYDGNGVPFWIIYDNFKTVSVYAVYLDRSHWLESPFKIMELKSIY